MKVSAEKLVSLLDAPPAERWELAQKFTFLSPGAFNPAQLERLTAEGFYEFKKVSWDGKPQYGIWFHAGIDGGLHVHAAVQLCEQPFFTALGAALALLTKARGCRFCHFQTARPGLVKKARLFGYEAQSVSLVKYFP